MSPFFVFNNYFCINPKKSKLKNFKIFHFGIFLLVLIFAMSSCKILQKPKKVQKKTELATEKDFYQNYSEILAYKLNGTENKKLITTISEWLGVPYKYGGCDKNGTDCSCLVKMIYQEVYGIELNRRSLDILNSCVKIKKDKLSEGDLVFFKTSKNKYFHVGIYISNNKFVHSTTKKGVIISDLDEPYWSNAYFSAGRIKNL